MLDKEDIDKLTGIGGVDNLFYIVMDTMPPDDTGKIAGAVVAVVQNKCTAEALASALRDVHDSVGNTGQVVHVRRMDSTYLEVLIAALYMSDNTMFDDDLDTI